jgi:type VI secretion system VasD/TssJ family lipoprotein
MHKRFRLSLLAWLLVVSFLAACAAQPVPPPQWAYEKDALQIHMVADPKLNFESGVPHTLVTCIYQLKDPNAFNQLSEDIDGIYKLLDCGLFDAGVATARRLIVHPGQDVNILLDRAEGAKYVAVVCGYYALEKARMIRLFEIPVVVEEKGLVKRIKTAVPQKLKVDLALGMEQID